MIVRAADPARDGDAILAIVNDAILNSTAWYEYAPWDGARLTSWFDAKRAGAWPLLASANNDLLAPFGILIDEALANLFDFTTSRNPHYKQALKLHENIVRAIVAEDPVAARTAMLALIKDTDQVIESLGRKR